MRYNETRVAEYRTGADARYGKKHDPTSVNFTEAIDKKGAILAMVTLEPTSHGQKHWVLTQAIGRTLRFKTEKQAMNELRQLYPLAR